MASKKKMTPARQTALKQYQKERNRIRSLVKGAEKRGYQFPAGTIPPTVSEIQSLPTVSIKSRTNQLKQQTPIRLYHKATAISEETGQRITGTKKLEEVRRESARVRVANQQVLKQHKAEQDFIDEIYESQTTGKSIEEVEQAHREAQRQREKWSQRERELAEELDKRVQAEISEDEVKEEEEKDYGDYGTNLPTEESHDKDFQPTQEETPFDAEAQWQAEQRAKDNANIERLNSDDSYASHFQYGELVLQGIQQLVDSAMSEGSYKQAGMDLSIELSQQINTYGRDKVILAMANAPEELISEAQIATHYNPGDERHDKAIIRIREIITGEIPSAKELKDQQDRMDADAYTNDI